VKKFDFSIRRLLRFAFFVLRLNLTRRNMSLAAAHPDAVPDESQDYIWTLNFGPQHPATHTTLRLVLKLDGERVVEATPDIGYLHSGFEKLGESLDYNQYVTVTDRMNYISPMSNNVAWHGAVEKLLGIELPKRAQYIRVIIAELSRISDHLLCNGAAGLDTGAFTYFMYAFYQREVLYDIFETLCGARFTNSYTRVGGLMYDMTRLVVEKIRAFVKDFPKTLEDMERLLNRNRIFIDRTKGVGVLSKDEAINRSASGPVARASGVTRDLRKDEPTLPYGDFDFQVCCAKAGDCYARYLVRMAEMRESLRIVEQAIENLPQGPINVPIGERTALPTKRMVYSTIEGTISHFELEMSNRGFKVPHDECYAAIEAPNGELGFYVVGNGSDVAWRARCRPPSFIHFALFPHLIRGHTLSDIVAVLGSLNIIAAELDR
jgi:NADH-quinone oxidoreductase subunit D